MNNVIKLIALVVLTLIIVLTYMNKAQAGGPWNDQYCNVKTTQVKMVDTNGVVIKEYTEERLDSLINLNNEGIFLFSFSNLSMK